MARKDFTQQIDIPIQNILLDTENARIRAGRDQNNCISRILRKENQMLVLMEDIAENGLTTMPILVMPHSEGKWVVKDGNRRITALKLLNNPDSCPEPHLIPKIKKIKEKYHDNIPTTVDCLSSDNFEAVFKEIIARHSGARNGAGQYDWFAYMRTIYLLNNGHPTDYKRAGQYMCWAEQEGIDVDDDFPITSVARFFTRDNLLLLGFEVENDKLKPILSKEKIIKMASKINSDFSSKIVDVNTVFNPSDAKKYLCSVRKHAGIIDDFAYNSDDTEQENNKKEETNKCSSPSEVDNNNAQSDSKSDAPVLLKKHAGRGGTPKKIPAERNKIFGRGKPGITIPENETKIRTIISELRQLDVKKTTLATAFLLRALLELSDKEYRTINKLQDKKSLAKNIANSADHMLKNNLITDSEHHIISAYTRGEQGTVHIETLQKLIHRETHHPDYISINVFWDNIGCFVRACWKD
ncbi:hypothetical protein C6A57_17115 [Escherichia coli]|uniref:ParB/Srx family N-terminal domain-containing protein n=1 Tax=Escherichia coli TaxID=562 RepID=UPI00077504DB|nr:ParB/Srx family N-terminal domain-containing protein [Escherichia coli]KXQ08152.1 hypothetical protein AUP98_15090 [Escherichia coli]OEL53533.1 hypothetical protein BHF08_21430 [Escherichia coli]RCA72060.1 hypothetical protein C6A61_24435 [Escherichia coli]RCE35078.1 hypothetical protein C6A57_17115 [Escherichia coli]